MDVDDYVFEVLMRDLVGHDKRPSAFLVYLHLWSRTLGQRRKTAELSHRAMAEATGLSKRAVQEAVRRLLRRRLIRSTQSSPTATPVYSVARPWKRS